MSIDAGNLIWIDLEMTGLAVADNRIIEIATVVTDSHLNILATGPNYAIWQPRVFLDSMDQWNTKQHGLSGLTAAVQTSTVSAQQAETETLSFLATHLKAGQSPMCGNSICLDRRFLARYMPRLEDFFHYRNLDVSSIKELAKRWVPDLIYDKQKTSTHRALQDTLESIEELIFYRKHFLCASIDDSE